MSTGLTIDPRRELALARVHGHGSLPPLAHDRAALTYAATEAGRVLIETRHGRDATFTLGWPDGSEPSTADPTSPRTALPDLPLVVLAAAIRACITDPDAGLYPSSAVSVDVIVDAVLAQRPHASQTAHDAVRRHIKGHLAKWRDTGHLSAPEHDPALIATGPALAAWTPSQQQTLLRSWHTLPVTSPTGPA